MEPYKNRVKEKPSYQTLPKNFFRMIVTCNEMFLKLIELAKRAAQSDITVLVTGENGTGKNLLAQALHSESPRKQGPFISVNCSAIPETLIESELFGHERGAFTNAYSRKKGKFELAHQGTLFLDEIGDMSLHAQSKILKAIEEQRFTRIGGETPTHVDVRVIAATNKNIDAVVTKGHFREDLFYRLKEVLIHLPPLRDRREDIVLLANTFLAEFNRLFNKTVKEISNIALSYLTKYSWPGNVRELRNIIKTSVALSDRDVLWLENFPFKVHLDQEQLRVDAQEDLSLKVMEKRHIGSVLHLCNWNKSKAATLMGISRPRLDRKIAEYTLKKTAHSLQPTPRVQP